MCNKAYKNIEVQAHHFNKELAIFSYRNPWGFAPKCLFLIIGPDWLWKKLNRKKRDFPRGGKQELSIGKKNKQKFGNITIKNRHSINIDGQRKCYSYKNLKRIIEFF